MARLPSLTSNTVIMRGGQSSVTAGDIASPFRSLSSALDTGANLVAAEGRRRAVKDGAASVYRDENGVLQAGRRSELFGDGRAYNAAAEKAYITRFANDVRMQSSDQSLAAGNNPAVFKKSWAAFTERAISNAPEATRSVVSTMLEREGVASYNGIMVRKKRADMQAYEGQLKAEIGLIDDDLQRLAESGAVNTPEFQQRQNDMRDLYQSLVNNPEFALSQREADIALERSRSRQMARAVVGDVRRLVNEGDVASAKELSDGILTDGKLTLSPSERRSLRSQGYQEISRYNAGRASQLKELRRQASEIKKRLDAGVGLDSDDVAEMARQLAAGGDPGAAMELLTTRKTAKFTQGFQGLNDAAQLAEYERMAAGQATSLTDASGNLDAGVVKDMQREIASDAKDMFDAIEAGVKAGLTPDPDSITLLSRQLAIINDEDMRSEIKGFFESEAGAAALSMMPEAQRNQAIDAIRASGGDGTTAAQAALLSAVQRKVRQDDRDFADDHMRFGVTRGLVKDVPDVAFPTRDDGSLDTDAIGAIFKKRNAAASIIRQSRGSAEPLSALTGPDMRKMEQLFNTGTPAEVAPIIGAMMDNLSPDVAQATLAAIGQKGGAARVAAVAGSLYSDNPAVSESLLRGQRILAENSKFGFGGDQATRNNVEANFPTSVFPQGMERAHNSVIQAARARYADLSYQAGDQSGDFDEDRFVQSVNEVTGGLIEYQGATIIAPRYGMAQGQFDDLMNKLPDEALAGATVDGSQPLKKSDLTGTYIWSTPPRLRSIGKGEYLIEFGAEENPTYATYATGGDKSGPFILNLGQ